MKEVETLWAHWLDERSTISEDGDAAVNRPRWSTSRKIGRQDSLTTTQTRVPVHYQGLPVWGEWRITCYEFKEGRSTCTKPAVRWSLYCTIWRWSSVTSYYLRVQAMLISREKCQILLQFLENVIFYGNLHIFEKETPAPSL